MNWRRGLFRLWLVFSAVFAIATAIVFFSDVKGEFKKAAVEESIAGDYLLVPAACDKARGKIGDDYRVLDFGGKNNCWYTVDKFRILYPEYNDLPDNELSDRLYKKAGIQTTPASPWSLVLKGVSIGIGVPLFILIAGSALGWSFAGFSSERKKSH